MKRLLIPTAVLASALSGAALATVARVPCPWYGRTAPPSADAPVPPTPAEPPGARQSWATPDPDLARPLGHSIGRDLAPHLPATVTFRPPAGSSLAQAVAGKRPGARVVLELRGVRPLAAHGCTLRVFLGLPGATAETAAVRPHWCATVGTVGPRVATFEVDVTEGVRGVARARAGGGGEGGLAVTLVVVEEAGRKQSVWVDRVGLQVEE